MRIGSGDIAALLLPVNSKGFRGLLNRFVADEPRNYNALNSPIEACRIGAILEGKYSELLPDDYFSQVRVKYPDMDVFTATLDYAKINNNKIVDFIEVKTIFFTDFIEKVEPIKQAANWQESIRTSFPKYYNQVQEQIMCSGLQSGEIVFIPVYSYDDEENYGRSITEEECAKFRITRDEEVISSIKDKGKIFQTIKNYLDVEI